MKNFKIPTLLGLAVLIGGLVAGVVLVQQKQILLSKASLSPAPKNIVLVNLTAHSASIYWQTDQPSSGFIKIGPTNSLGLTFRDDRDLGAPANHLLHFVTINNLLPSTTYYYQVVSGDKSYPLGNPATFKTPQEFAATSQSPLIGKIVGPDYKAVDEVLAKLELPGAQVLAAITKTTGNFVLPLNYTNYNFQASSSASLTLIGPNLTSKITLHLPLPSTTLPTLFLGQDLDLQNQLFSPGQPTNPYDLNHDGVVNSFDVQILRANFGKNPQVKEADLNNDGVVDQKDLDLMNKYLQSQTTK